MKMSIKQIRDRLSELKKLIDQKPEILNRFKESRRKLDQVEMQSCINELKMIQEYVDESKKMENALILRVSQSHRGMEMNGFTDGYSEISN